MAPRRVNGAGRPATAPASGFDWRDWIDPRRFGWFRLLLAFLPVAVVLRIVDAPASWRFVAALLAILPLAAVMGDATEQLAHRAGPGVGGLLNATFGNAAELIIALALLFAGKDTAVKASLTGSILGNVLLVLGGSMLAGGLTHRNQRFNRTAATSAATMLVLAAIGLLVPAIFHELPEVDELRDEVSVGLEHTLSVAVCLALMVTYVLGLVFSLKTHRDIFNPERTAPADDRHREEDGPPPSLVRATTILLLATVAVAVASEILAGSIEEAGHRWGLSEVFLGVVVVAIVGNAAEHSTAVVVAVKDQMDLAVGIALGSALQVAMFVAPILVFASYLRPEPMDLLFTTMEVVAVILGVLIAHMATGDGESNWLEGVMLLMVYVILGVAFFVLPVAHHDHPAATAPAAVAPAGP